ncbi:MAG TPA: hypothetical protein VGA99_01340 [bacterium]
MKRLLLFFAASLILTNSITPAQGIFFNTYVAPQTLRPSDPVSTALGVSGVAHRTGVWAPLFNPAGLAELSQIEFSFSHIPSAHSWIFPFKQQTAALGVPMPFGFAAGLTYLFVDRDL